MRVFVSVLERLGNRKEKKLGIIISATTNEIY